MLKKGLFITGTDTSVGKTQVTAGLAAVLQQRLNRIVTTKSEDDTPLGFAQHQQVRLWKPVQSGTAVGSLDADSYRLWKGSGLLGTEADIVTHTFAEPLAPWIAAQYANDPIDYNELVAEGQRRIAQSGILLIEGAGGLFVPLTDSKLIVDLACDLKLPILLIARPSLGTVNHTLLTLSYAAQAGLDVVGVIFNGCLAENEVQINDNAMMIEQFSGVPVIGKLPWLSHDNWDEQGWLDWRRTWCELIERHVQLDGLFNT